MQTTLLIELHFLPSLEYFCALRGFNEILIERHERFVKQSYRNRCYIKTTQRIEMLSVPLVGKHHQSLFRDIRIDNTRPWAKSMWRTIMSAYRSAPFYEHYAPDLEAILSQRHEFIYDLDMDLLSFCLAALHWEKTLSETTAYTEETPLQTRDLRSLITSRNDFAVRKLYKPLPYYQVFGSAFGENLSLLDVLFCKGPLASEIIDASSTTD